MFESNGTNSHINSTDISQNATDNGTNIYEDLNTEVIEIFWLLGIGTSALCLLLQIFLYILIPSSRKVDQKILTQMTVARLLNVLFEYFVFHANLIHNVRLKDAVFSIYQQTDAALICWMFIFTKNLYDKVIVVFNTKPNFILISVSVWISTLPIGLLCPFLLKHNVFDTFYYIYSIVKFLILAVNVLLFCRIFWIAMVRKNERNDGGKGLLRTLIVCLILVSITSLQVFLTDLTSFALDMYPRMLIVFCVVNSYEAVAVTALFFILVQGVTEGSVCSLIKKRLHKTC